MSIVLASFAIGIIFGMCITFGVMLAPSAPEAESAWARHKKDMGL